MLVDEKTLEGFDKRFRVNFINSLSGYKSANLVATVNGKGQENLAIFSSAVHLGANPALLGLVSRPNVVPRDTIENIKTQKLFTLSHVNEAIFKQAHQTSARFEKGESEFKATGLTPEYHEGFAAPFVGESQLAIGLELEEILPIAANGCDFIIAKILWVKLPEQALLECGNIDLNAIKTVAVSSLDTYHLPKKLARLAYAKPDKKAQVLND